MHQILIVSLPALVAGLLLGKRIKNRGIVGFLNAVKVEAAQRKYIFMLADI